MTSSGEFGDGIAVMHDSGRSRPLEVNVALEITLASVATGFRMPFDSGALTLTQEYGIDKGLTSFPTYIHLGEDYSGGLVGTTAIRAAGNGTVVAALNNKAFGNHVILQHVLPDGTKIFSLYAHMDSWSAAVGHEVSAGDEIGVYGKTGAVTGAHLHFEISYVNGFNNSGMYGKGYDSPEEFQTSGLKTIDPSNFIAAHPLVSITEGADSVQLTFSGGTWSVLGGADSVRGTSGADTIYGGSGNDSLIGAGNNDYLSGGTGEDCLQGGLGADSLYGGDGNDDLRGGDGSDFLNGGFGFDTIFGGDGQDTTTYTFFSGKLIADLSSGIVSFPGNSSLTETLISVENITSGDGDDVLRGNAAANVLKSGLGNDSLFGGDGDDFLDGGFGFDSISGGNGQDTTSYTFFSGNLVANLSTGVVSFPGNSIFTDKLYSIENINCGSGNDLVTGNGSANALSGGLGADTLVGGIGCDSLYGGGDSVRDVFRFTKVTDSTVGSLRDVIVGFASAIDDIDLSLIDANNALSGNQSFRFSGTTAASNAVWYVDSGTSIVVRADVSGDSVADFEVRIASTESVIAADFIL